jgi:hypothetical protein
MERYQEQELRLMRAAVDATAASSTTAVARRGTRAAQQSMFPQSTHPPYAQRTRTRAHAHARTRIRPVSDGTSSLPALSFAAGSAHCRTFEFPPSTQPPIGLRLKQWRVRANNAHCSHHQVPSHMLGRSSGSWKHRRLRIAAEQHTLGIQKRKPYNTMQRTPHAPCPIGSCRRTNQDLT